MTKNIYNYLNKNNHNENGNPHSQYVGATKASSIVSASNAYIQTNYTSFYWKALSFQISDYSTDPTSKINMRANISVYSSNADMSIGEIYLSLENDTSTQFKNQIKRDLTSTASIPVYLLEQKMTGYTQFMVYIQLPTGYHTAVVAPTFLDHKNDNLAFNNLGVVEQSLPASYTVEYFPIFGKFLSSNLLASNPAQWYKILEIQPEVSNSTIRTTGTIELMIHNQDSNTHGKGIIGFRIKENSSLLDYVCEFKIISLFGDMVKTNIMYTRDYSTGIIALYYLCNYKDTVTYRVDLDGKLTNAQVPLRIFTKVNSAFYQSASITLPNNQPPYVDTLSILSGSTGSRPTYSLPVGRGYFDTSLSKEVRLKTAGVQEVDTLTVSTGATASGNITITLNGVGTNVAVTSGDSANTIAFKIASTNFSGWTVTNSGATVTFKKNTVGTNSTPTFTDTGTTGTTTSFVVTTTGTAHVWVDGTGATV